MSRAKRPSVKLRCVADAYAPRDERIVEFSSPDGKAGGLISFRVLNGVLQVTVYRTDNTVVTHGAKV